MHLYIAKCAATLSIASVLVSTIASPVSSSKSLHVERRPVVKVNPPSARDYKHDASHPLVEEAPEGKVKWTAAPSIPTLSPHPERNKYFHEPGGDDNLGHYDKRYFNGIVSYEERTETQIHMIRAYLKWFKGQGLDTWIAHGTLLGWWWNGKRLPWDWDMDTQVSSATLKYLGEKHNQTIISYANLFSTTSSLDSQGRKREYLLDVNPWIWQRERGDGMNIIDARWIDVRNGLFIDITGLAETRPAEMPGVWSCKNYHRYSVEDLYPMRESVFEGVEALVPYGYEGILRREYGAKALFVGEFQRHAWNKEGQEWVITEEGIKEEKKKEQQRQFKKNLEEKKKAKEEKKKNDEKAKEKEVRQGN